MGGTLLKVFVIAVYGLIMWGVAKFAGFGYHAYGWPFVLTWLAGAFFIAWLMDLHVTRKRRREEAESLHHRAPR